MTYFWSPSMMIDRKIISIWMSISFMILSSASKPKAHFLFTYCAMADLPHPELTLYVPSCLKNTITLTFSIISPCPCFYFLFCYIQPVTPASYICAPIGCAQPDLHEYRMDSGSVLHENSSVRHTWRHISSHKALVGQTKWFQTNAT